MEKKSLVFKNCTPETINELIDMGLTEGVKSDPNIKYSIVGVSPDRKTFCKFTNWEYSVTPVEGIHECSDEKEFLRTIASDRYWDSCCIDEAIDYSNKITQYQGVNDMK